MFLRGGYVFNEMKEITRHFKETVEVVEYMRRAFEEPRRESAIQNAVDTAVILLKMGNYL